VIQLGKRVKHIEVSFRAEPLDREIRDTIEPPVINRRPNMLGLEDGFDQVGSPVVHSLLDGEG
jgi:hypothetical protein